MDNHKNNAASASPLKRFVMPDGSVIEKVFVHWSESELISKYMGEDEDGNIDKFIDPVVFDGLIKEASALVYAGYDKIKLTVKFDNGFLIDEVKVYLTPVKDSLVKLISAECQ